ncbi:hypothetical protein VNO77_31142 [Canavalia gladiata]|uniref:Nodulation-signaling pathway 2 protein n=1 Tax=Canavalia gladiata TaxID=3824 RepID=A0AAN9Q3K6_CANGL
MVMYMSMDGVPHPHLPDFSDYSTTTSTSYDDGACDWNLCSPLIDSDSFAAIQDDFHALIGSLMDDGVTPDQGVVEEESSGDEFDDQKGLRLVHLLMAAAEALTGGTESHDLARAILVRLNELVSLTHGTNMERLAAYFTFALQDLLDGTAGAHGTINGNQPHLTDMLAAFHLLQDMSPYVKFAHFTSNQAILEAVAHERRVHIVDYDVMEGAQWASLIQALSSKSNSPHLRITALSRGGTAGRRSIATVQETGRRLTAFAASSGQPFSFHTCRLDPDETFRPSSLKLVRGEVLVFNCVLHLPHLSYRAHNSVASFLKGAKETCSRLVTLVEEEVGPVGDAGFVGLFMDSLAHYSAVFDSLEVGFPMQRWAQALVEKEFLSPRIRSSVARMYRSGEEEKKSGSWGSWLGEAGFRGVPISFANHCQANLLVGLFNDGYRMEELGNNKLVLGWKSRRLLSASVWTSHTLHS